MAGAQTVARWLRCRGRGSRRSYRRARTGRSPC